MGKKVEVSGFKVCEGRSIVETMEDHLDDLIEELINGDHPYPDSLKARTLGVAECIALIRNPYNPDVDLIREQAMARRSG